MRKLVDPIGAVQRASVASTRGRTSAKIRTYPSPRPRGLSPKAVGQPEGLAELMVFYWEQAAGFCHDIGFQDEGYFQAENVRQVLKAVMTLPIAQWDSLRERIDRVRRISHSFGYGVGDDMDDLLAEAD